MNQKQKEIYMKKAIRIAHKGINNTGLNPIVGAVLVKNNKVIGQGYHEKITGNHAEVNAILNAESKGEKISGATLFVTLEPCCHKSKKTPPCVDYIIQKGIKKVIFLEYDVNPKVNGKGVKILEKNKLKVEQIFIKNSLDEINRGFKKSITDKIPFISLKLCVSFDGKIFSNKLKNNLIGDFIQKKHSNELRKNYDSILVGVNTIIKDNPELTYRGKINKYNIQPIPIVLDSKLRTPKNSKILSNPEIKPIFIVKTSVSKKKEEDFKKLGVKIIKLPNLSPNAILKALNKLELQRLLIEGGAKVFSSFLESNLWDEIILYYSNIFIGNEGVNMTSKFKKIIKLKEENLNRFKKVGNNYMIILKQ